MTYSDNYLLQSTTQPLTAACKTLTVPPGHECFQSHGRMLAKEAAALLLLQDASKHPSGHGCSNLPRLFGMNEWQGILPRPGMPRHCKAKGPHLKVTTALLMEYIGVETLAGWLARRREETRPSDADLEAIRSSEGGATSEPLLTPLQLWSTAAGIVTALLHVYSGGLANCDVKTQNVVLNKEGVPYLIDFGLAEKLGTHVSHPLGTPGFNAPEVSKAGGQVEVSEKIDVFSLGQVLLLMVLPESTRLLTQLKDVPPERMHEALCAHKNEHGYASIYIGSQLSCNEQMLQLIRRCTHPDPGQRPSIPAVFNCVMHGYLQVLLDMGFPVPPGHPSLRVVSGHFFTPVPPGVPPPPLPATPPPPPSGRLRIASQQPPPADLSKSPSVGPKPTTTPTPGIVDTPSTATPMVECFSTPTSALRGTPSTASPSTSNSRSHRPAITSSAGDTPPPLHAVKPAPCSPTLEVGCKFAPEVVWNPHAALFVPAKHTAPVLRPGPAQVHAWMPVPPGAWQHAYAAVWPHPPQVPMQAAPAWLAPWPPQHCIFPVQNGPRGPRRAPARRR